MGDGTGDKLKGHTKEAAGDLTGDKSLKNEGKVDRASGSVKDKVGGAADKVEGRDPQGRLGAPAGHGGAELRAAVGLAHEVVADRHDGRAQPAQGLLGDAHRHRRLAGELLAQLRHPRLGVVDDLGGEADRERLVGLDRAAR